jgi:protease I
MAVFVDLRFQARLKRRLSVQEKSNPAQACEGAFRMSTLRLTGQTIGYLVGPEVEDLEYWVPLMRLREEGAEVISIGITNETLYGKHGLEITPDVGIAEAPAAEALHGLVIPGGWAPDKLRRDQRILQLVRDLDAQQKIIGIICHGGWVAISAGILRGRKATGSTGIKDDITNAGGIWVDSPAFREGNLVWGRVVADIPDFCRELVAALSAN